MKRSELADICNEIIKIHIEDLTNETNEYLAQIKNSDQDPYEFIGKTIGTLSVLNIKHSIQAVSDVLLNVGLLELEDD